MAYKKISGKTTESLERDLSENVFGGNNMKEGKHTATLIKVELEADAVWVKFENESQETFSNRLFVHNFHKTDLNYTVKQLAASLASDVDELWEITDNPALLENCVGRKVELEVGFSEGVEIRRTEGGLTAGQITAATFSELKQKLTERGLKIRSPKIIGVEPYDSSKATQNQPETRGDSGSSNTNRRSTIPAHLQF